MSGNFCVFTGDLVGSTKAGAGAVDRAMALLSDAASGAAWAGLRGPFTRFRGDGWQVLLDRPERAARLALVLQAALRADLPGLETRIALGFGPVTQMGSHDLSDADGPAFLRAGRALDGMKRGRLLVLEAEGSPLPLQAAIPLFDALIRRWTPAQAAALRPLLAPNPPQQTDLARTLGIKPQSLSDRLSGAALDQLLDSLRGLERMAPDQARGPDSGKSGM